MGIALVIYASVQIASNNTIYYYTTSEATSALDVDNSERIKLGGFVQNDSIENKGNGVTSFFITDGNEKIEIIFDGFVPELFRDIPTNFHDSFKYLRTIVQFILK